MTRPTRRLILGRPQGIEVLRFKNHVLIRTEFVAFDYGGGIDRSVHWTLLRVQNPLDAVGMELMEVGDFQTTHGGIGLEGNADQAEL